MAYTDSVTGTSTWASDDLPVPQNGESCDNTNERDRMQQVANRLVYLKEHLEVDQQVFEEDGTWDKPDGALWVSFLLVGPGWNGGDAGAGETHGAGGGGAGTIVETHLMPESMVPSSLDVYVGEFSGETSSVQGTGWIMQTAASGSKGQDSSDGGGGGEGAVTSGPVAGTEREGRADGGAGGVAGANGDPGGAGRCVPGAIGGDDGSPGDGGHGGKGYGAGGGGAGGSWGGGGGGACGYGTSQLASDGQPGQDGFTAQGGLGAPGVVIITTWRG